MHKLRHHGFSISIPVHDHRVRPVVRKRTAARGRLRTAGPEYSCRTLGRSEAEFRGVWHVHRQIHRVRRLYPRSRHDFRPGLYQRGVELRHRRLVHFHRQGWQCLAHLRLPVQQQMRSECRHKRQIGQPDHLSDLSVRRQPWGEYGSVADRQLQPKGSCGRRAGNGLRRHGEVSKQRYAECQFAGHQYDGLPHERRRQRRVSGLYFDDLRRGHHEHDDWGRDTGRGQRCRYTHRVNFRLRRC